MPGNRDRERGWQAMPAGTREALTRRLPPADLRTLLIGVARARAKQVTPADVMRQWQHDRFVRPSAAGPRRGAAVEAAVRRRGQPKDRRTDLAACQLQR
jgi:hypothetical protein